MTDVEVGYHASHEQFPPDDLVDLVRLAEAHGFDAALASDHFAPWSERQGESGFVWSWLGAAMEATDLTFATVNAPGYRYHPTNVAQAAATLRRMYPGRFRLCVGSGELLNEHVTGERWPAKDERNARLRECVDVMRRLWDGETVTHRGLVTVEEATLYTRPETPPPVFGAALSPETARWLGEWADGMLTVGTPDHEGMAQVVEAFRGEAPEKPVYVKVQLSYAENEEAALSGAHDQWRTNCVPGPLTQNLRTTAQFDAVGELIDAEDVREHVRVSADPKRHVEWLRRDVELGADGLFLHNVNREQAAFVEDFGERVLPELRE